MLDRRKPLGDLLRDSIDEERVEGIRIRIAERRQEPARPRARRITLVAAAASVTALVAAGLALSAPELSPLHKRRAEPLRLASGPELQHLVAAPSADAARRFDLDDGSTIELAPGAEVTAGENSGRHVKLRLSQGRATFEVARGGPRLWQIDAGLASVEVVGTLFTVDRNARRVVVAVERGRVRVRAPGLPNGLREISAGEQVEVTPTESIEEEPIPEEPEAPVEQLHVPARTWLELARDEEFGAAYALLGASGIRREIQRAETMEVLLTLADVARHSGHAGDAVSPLSRAIERFPADRRSAVASFTLGRVESDSLGHHGRAARAFRRCLELGPPRALREDAYARLAEAHAGAGQYDAARAAAAEYLQQYPDGRRAEDLRRWVE